MKDKFQLLICVLILTLCMNSNVYSITDTWLDNNDGTVIDRATGRMWQKNDDGVMRNHVDAVSYCQSLNLGGSDVWRLPNIKELSSLIDYRTYSPAIDKTAFPDAAFLYWSSSNRVAISSEDAYWIVNFGGGSVSSLGEDFALNVRCVRAPSL